MRRPGAPYLLKSKDGQGAAATLEALLLAAASLASRTGLPDLSSRLCGGFADGPGEQACSLQDTYHCTVQALTGGWKHEMEPPQPRAPQAAARAGQSVPQPQLEQGAVAPSGMQAAETSSWESCQLQGLPGLAVPEFSPDGLGALATPQWPERLSCGGEAGGRPFLEAGPGGPDMNAAQIGAGSPAASLAVPAAAHASPLHDLADPDFTQFRGLDLAAGDLSPLERLLQQARANVTGAELPGDACALRMAKGVGLQANCAAPATSNTSTELEGSSDEESRALLCEARSLRFCGADCCSPDQRWRAGVAARRKKRCLGRFNSTLDAALALDHAACAAEGVAAFTNFSLDGQNITGEGALGPPPPLASQAAQSPPSVSLPAPAPMLPPAPPPTLEPLPAAPPLFTQHSAPAPAAPANAVLALPAAAPAGPGLLSWAPAAPRPYMGVTWSQQHAAWEARIWSRSGEQHTLLGRFPSAEAAGAAYDAAALRLHGAHAFTNFSGPMGAEQAATQPVAAPLAPMPPLPAAAPPPNSPCRARGGERGPGGKPPLGKGSSKFRGVSWHKDNMKWRATIFKGSKPVHIGYFETQEEAARAYDVEALRLRGPTTSLNFPAASLEAGMDGGGGEAAGAAPESPGLPRGRKRSHSEGPEALGKQLPLLRKQRPPRPLPSALAPALSLPAAPSTSGGLGLAGLQSGGLLGPYPLCPLPDARAAIEGFQDLELGPWEFDAPALDPVAAKAAACAALERSNELLTGLLRPTQSLAAAASQPAPVTCSPEPAAPGPLPRLALGRSFSSSVAEGALSLFSIYAAPGSAPAPPRTLALGCAGQRSGSAVVPLVPARRGMGPFPGPTPGVAGEAGALPSLPRWGDRAVRTDSASNSRLRPGPPAGPGPGDADGPKPWDLADGRCQVEIAPLSKP